MRITTNSVMNNYIYNLNTIMGNRDSAGNQTMTHRKFTKASQDPRSAQTASLLHRRYLQNKDYISTVKDIKNGWTWSVLPWRISRAKAQRS